MSEGGRKIPCNCPACGEVLSYHEMETFLAMCEKWGCDPVEFAYRVTPPGVPCGKCWVRAIADGAERKDPMVEGLVEKMKNLYQYGVADLPGGKPPVFH